MEKILLEVELKEKNIDHVLKRCHFQPSDNKKMMALYEALRPLITAKAYYLWDVPGLSVNLQQYAAAFLTLGTGLDALQDLYLSSNHMLEAYMIDCLGLELLSAAYEEYARQMQCISGKSAVKLHFIGDEYPFSFMDQMQQAMGETDITYNEQYVMSPQKSVAFLLEMKEQEEETSLQNFRHICSECKNVNCEYRQRDNYTYGYQRIFGRK